jgi:hypothetical protein
MTGSTNRPRLPGTILLKISRALFNEHLLSAVVEPTIADLQREIADAGRTASSVCAHSVAVTAHSGP